MSAVGDRDVPGGDAAAPRQIPPSGWWHVCRRAWVEAKADQVSLLAAGVAFFGFLSLFPAVIAVVLAYGLLADPADVRSRAEDFATTLPSSARDLLLEQVTSLTATRSSALGIGFVIALVVALWSASGGVGHLVDAVNLAYDEDETRGFVKRKGLALALTVGAIAFLVVVLALVAVVPPVLDALALPGPAGIVVEIGRWVVLAVLISLALAIVYRLAPARDAPRFRWVSIGAIVATVLWLLASFGFSVYVDTFGNYAKTYGSLAGVVVLLLWLWISVYAVLLGAELNAESEEQTARDTTVGPEQPIGRRGAVKADSVPPGRQ